MNRRFILVFLLFFVSSLFSIRESKTLDPYKVLGVDKTAGQREIQKAFHRLSLQYHPDKNKSKGAQEKFAEINNAYEILSDEEKRKNYDLYGDEKGSPQFDPGNSGSQKEYTYFTTRGPANDHFSSHPGGWQTMGGHGNNPHADLFDFDFGDIFSKFFDTGAGGPKSGSAPSASIADVNLQFFNNEIRDQGLSWLLEFYASSNKRRRLESIMEDVTGSLSGAVKAGRIDCSREQTLCKDLGAPTFKLPRLFMFSYRNGDQWSLVEYFGGDDSRSLKNFCLDQLPRISRRVDLRVFDFSTSTKNPPQVLLLSTKKDTPVMWRAISGLYRKRFVFHDAEVVDVSHPVLKRLGVGALPAIVGRLVDGEVHVLKSGIAVKNLKSGIRELEALLDGFEKKNRKAASSQRKKPSQTESQWKSVPSLTKTNFDSLCGNTIVVCIIGVYRSPEAKQLLEAVIFSASQKTSNEFQILGVPISYSMLDAKKQTGFLYAFDRSGFKFSDKLLVAYKPKKGKFAVYTGEMEGVERFVSSVLSGDVRFSPVKQKPVVQ